MKWLAGFGVLILLLVIWSAVYGRIRAGFNFRVVYRRALRAEGRKDLAIAAALGYLSGFLRPFSDLTEADISFVAAEFAILNDPQAALQPILEFAQKEGSVRILRDRSALVAMRDQWKQLREA